MQKYPQNNNFPHNKKCVAYPHEELNTLKRVIRSKGLSLATLEEITATHGIIDYKRIIIRKSREEIQTNTHILTFNQHEIPKEVKTEYFLKRVKQYIPALLRCFKSQKYGYHSENCREHLLSGRYGQEDLDHIEEHCSNETKYSNCQQNQHNFSRPWNIYKKERNTVI